MRVVLPIFRDGESLLFQKDGTVISPHKFSVADGRTVVIDLSSGIHWLFHDLTHGVHVRYYRITDAYPIGSKEILETDYWEFPFHKYDTADEWRTHIESIMKKSKDPACHFPKPLTDAICAAVEKNKRSRH